MSKPWVFLDIDGCLVSEEGSTPFEYYKALSDLAKYIMAANIGMFPNVKICSGRNINFVEAIIHLIGRPQSGFSIIENGAVLYDPIKRSIIINPQISPRAKKLMDYLKRKVVPRILKKYPCLWVWPGNIINITLVKEAETASSIHTLKKGIAEMLFKLLKKGAIRLTASRSAISILPPGTIKGNALIALSELDQHKGIDLSNSLGIGDGETDLSFMRKMGKVGCPQNADEICKDLVRSKRGHISQFPHAQGVMDVVRHYFPE
jgi:hydroxymethylpyrimidine pyrophosphatase-like HAD family hydrolase